MRARVLSWCVVTGVILGLSSLSLAQDKKDTAKPEAKPAQAKPEAKPAQAKPDAKKPDAAKGDKKAEPGKGDAGKPGQGMPPEMMEAMMKAGSPGEHHKHFADRVGKWNLAMKTAMAPDAPMTECKATAETKLLLDGRFVWEEVNGEAMEPGMPPFHGIGISGYDNQTKKHTSLWMDNMGTSVMLMEGACDGTCKTINFSGDYTCPMDNSKHKSRAVVKAGGKDKAVFEMFDTGPDGKEYKCLEITYTRAAP